MKGRVVLPGIRGEQCHLAKLTVEKVIEMRKQRAQGASYDELAVIFSVSKTSAHKACTGSTWAHVV